MVRKKIENSKHTEPKKTQGRRKRQTQQEVGPASHCPLQMADTFTGMFSMIMPMVMLVLMMAILMPMLKGTATK